MLYFKRFTMSSHFQKGTVGLFEIDCLQVQDYLVRDWRFRKVLRPSYYESIAEMNMFGI